VITKYSTIASTGATSSTTVGWSVLPAQRRDAGPVPHGIVVAGSGGVGWCSGRRRPAGPAGARLVAGGAVGVGVGLGLGGGCSVDDSLGSISRVAGSGRSGGPERSSEPDATCPQVWGRGSPGTVTHR
jgi:hypothetical protein